MTKFYIFQFAAALFSF